jgi:tetratricopeptide (TPR) repeat protein
MKFMLRYTSHTILLTISLVAMIACQSGDSNEGNTNASENDTTTQRVVQNDFRVGDEVVGRDMYGGELRAFVTDSSMIRLKDSLRRDVLAEYEADPVSLELGTTVGRRLVDMGQYRDALNWYTREIEKNPKYLPNYRHRGELYYHLQKIDSARIDLEKAKNMSLNEPNMIEYGIDATRDHTPVYNSHFNVFYYLGLLHYLEGDYEVASRTFGYAMNYSENPDLKSIATFWLAMTFKKLGKEGQTSRVIENVDPEEKIVENKAYHDLVTMLQGYKSMKDVLDAYSSAKPDQSATANFGVAMWLMFDGQEKEAKKLFDKVVNQQYWMSDVYPIAQKELNQLSK